jgi:hypothetical protein
MTGLEAHQQKHLGSIDNTGKRISVFTKVAGPAGAYSSYPVVSVSYFPIGERGTGRRGDPSPPSSVTVCGAEPLLLHYTFMLSYPNYTDNSNLPILNTTRKNKIAYSLFKRKGHRTPSIIHVQHVSIMLHTAGQIVTVTTQALLLNTRKVPMFQPRPWNSLCCGFPQSRKAGLHKSGEPQRPSNNILYDSA